MSVCVCAQFLAMMGINNTDFEAQVEEKECMTMFRMLDKTGSGFLTPDAALHDMVAKCLSTSATHYNHESSSSPAADRVVEKMIRQADLDGDGKLNYEEFIQLVKLVYYEDDAETLALTLIAGRRRDPDANPNWRTTKRLPATDGS